MNKKTSRCTFSISPSFVEERQTKIQQTKIQREESDGCIKEGCMWYNKSADLCTISNYEN